MFMDAPFCLSSPFIFSELDMAPIFGFASLGPPGYTLGYSLNNPRRQ